MTRQTLYRRHRDTLVEWGENGKLVLVDCGSWRKFSVKPALLDLLSLLDHPRSARDVHGAWASSSRPEEEVRRLLEQLAGAGIVRRAAPGDGGPAPDAPEAGQPAHGDGTGGGPVSGGAPQSTGWTPYELAVHAQASRSPVPAPRRGDPPPARLLHAEALERIPLPEGVAAPSRPLDQVLADRHSIRQYDSSPVPLPLLAAFFARTARVRGYLPPLKYEQTHRAAPSGGARHSLELYLVARDVAGLAAGAYHYDPFGHALERLAPWDEELADLQRRTLCVPMEQDQLPPASLYLTSCAYRTGWKYEGMTLSLIYRDTGCLMQTLSLVGTDIGLATCLTGRVEAPMTPSFLHPYRDRLIHVGNMALGLPAATPAASRLVPVATTGEPQQP
ncbi:SagB/ThcOx family dehydrogenase [Actinacidiphila oryziradicis]|uniref:SagB/ThcOx family dehydrogenase n=1 Tax=Actinacidiphila oryziradicis TaxID=2571141 RepID=A0A4U0RRV5_9ACTN|nr:SagB/ThcOx family dehydrogenase [Actinacidiphila oryziradicis]TJZ98803.1 SagB/ThcOx family dehydrogenase [Actinacidiphila oryziradicis]